jgi:hypothetical protein
MLCAGTIAILGMSLPAKADVRDWLLFGDNAKEYAIGWSEGLSFGGKPSGGIQSTGFNLSGSGVMARRIPARDWWGKRVRYSVLIKTVQTQGTVGAWLGLEVKTDGKPTLVATETTLLKEPLTGSLNDWAKRSIVVSVPPGTDNLLVGIILNGRGLAVLNNVRLDEEVDLPKQTDLNDFAPGH